MAEVALQSLSRIRGAIWCAILSASLQARGLTFKLAKVFPQNGLKAARLAMVGAGEGWAPDFTRATYLLQFRDGADISETDTLIKALAAAGQDPDVQLPRIQDAAVKDAFKAQNDKAQGLGIFGAPTFITGDGELFWGDDRLESALDWASARVAA